jgi:hypothetical protein
MRTNFFSVAIVLALLIPSAVFADKAEVVLYKSGCSSYFIADGPKGYYLLEWYGGYDPSKGDIVVGEIGSYGFKNVYYPKQDREGRVYVDDYMLSKDRVLEKYRDKCK